MNQSTNPDTKNIQPKKPKLKDKVFAAIPNKISNKTVIHVQEILRKEQNLFHKPFPDHYEANVAAMPKHQEEIDGKGKGFVENQHAYRDMAFGNSTMADSGCQIFAIYNALYFITGRHEIPLPDMIREFEEDGILRDGSFGATARSGLDYLRNHGYISSKNSKTPGRYRCKFTPREEEFPNLVKSSRACIVLLYNNRNNLMDGLHNICITNRRGKLTAHNVDCNGKVYGPFNDYESLIQSIDDGQAKFVYMVGLK